MRDGRFGLRKTSVALTAFLLVLSACSGDDSGGETSSTTPPTTSSISSPRPTPSTTSGTTTAVEHDWQIGETVLVAADDGVYQIGAEGDVTLLLAGRVAFAVDDTQGGLLFQVDRGRTGDQQAARSTIVWWIPSGASTPQELLVPTPGVGHRLSLHDAYATDDGFAVLYTRHEGVTPDVDMIDRLRRFDVPAREVTELYSSGAFEHGYGHVSTNGELIAGVWYQQLGSGCFIYDLDGKPTDLVPTEASDPTSEDSVRGCRLSPGGDRLSFFTEQYEDSQHVSTMLQVWDLNADTETTRFVVPGSAGVPSDLDASATKAIATFADENHQQTLVFNLNAPEADHVVLPIAGRARFVDAPVDIGVPVRSPGGIAGGPDYYRYGDDGLYRVADGIETQLSGDPIAWVYDDLMGGLVFRYPGDVSSEVWWLGTGATEPESLPVAGVWDAALVDGRPTLLVSVEDPRSQYCPNHDYIGPPVMLHDLVTGDQAFLFCDDEGPDGGQYSTSLGGSLLVSVEWVAVGGMYTDRRIVFMDLSGQEVTVDTNPVQEPCWPCFLSALISDDGSLLAYTLWPTAFWDVPVPDGDYASAYDTWRTTAKTVSVDVAVVDLASGGERWHITLDPDVRLADFDGRYLVIQPFGFANLGTTVSVIYDTWGVHEPVEVAGGVALIHESADATGITLRPDGLGIASFGEPAEDVLATMTSLLGPPDTEYFVDPVAEQIAMPHGFAANRYFRFASWDQIGMYIVMSDSDYFRDDGEPHFVGWSVTRPGFQTEARLGVGATVTELVAAYGEAVALPERFFSECDQGWTFQVGSPVPPDSSDYIDSMHGELSGDPVDPLSRVVRLSGGATSSC